MKLFIILALGLIGFRSNAQIDTCREHKWLEVGLFTTSVITGALGDGLNSRTKYGSGHLLSAASYVSLLAIPIFSHVSKKHAISYVISYTLIRYALFDAFYNVGANRKLNYIGGKNYYDESIGKMPLSVLNGTKIASVGIVILLNLKRK